MTRIRVEAKKLSDATSAEPSSHGATSATQMSRERCLFLYNKQKKTHALPENCQGIENAFQLARITCDTCACLPISHYELCDTIWTCSCCSRRSPGAVPKRSDVLTSSDRGQRNFTSSEQAQICIPFNIEWCFFARICSANGIFS